MKWRSLRQLLKYWDVPGCEALNRTQTRLVWTSVTDKSSIFSSPFLFSALPTSHLRPKFTLCGRFLYSLMNIISCCLDSCCPIFCCLVYYCLFPHCLLFSGGLLFSGLSSYCSFLLCCRFLSFLLMSTTTIKLSPSTWCRLIIPR